MITEDKIVKRLDQLINKGDPLIANAKLDSYGINHLVDQASFAAWRAQILNLLVRSLLLDQDDVYLQEFGPIGPAPPVYTSVVKRYQEVLRALKEDILDGYLTDVKTLISAEIFDDFLDMAEHLLECSYKDPAGSLCGAVLENGLRRIASNASIELKPVEGLSSLNRKCCKAEIYTKIVHDRLQVWIDVRNSADHGQFNEYSEQDVQDMLKGVRKFLGDYLR